MTEGEVVEQLVEFTNIVLMGVSLIFSVVSAYIVALNYFIGSANFMARLGSFAFITLVLGMLMAVMAGAQTTHAGPDRAAERTRRRRRTHRRRPRRARQCRARPWHHHALTRIDEIVPVCIWAGFGFVYLALAYLTFLHHLDA